MRSRGQETGELQQNCMVIPFSHDWQNSALLQDSLSCCPNPLDLRNTLQGISYGRRKTTKRVVFPDLPDEFVPIEPEELKHKGA